VPDFEAIYLEHFQCVYKYVMSLCQNKAIAEDITQESFYKAMENIDKFDGDGQLSTWLCQIAKNTYFSYYRKHKRIVPEDDGSRSPLIFLDFESDIVDDETSRQLHLLLHDLSEPYKEVFMLRVFGELPFLQIGTLFGKTDSWARLVYYRAKSELRKGLDENNM